jgi:hypothetical protein
MHTKTFLSLAIFALTLAACSDDKDTTGPEITLKQPQNEAAFARGESIPIEFDLADPSGIKEYKIDIHYAGDEHTHDAHSHALSIKLAAEEAENPWEYEYIQDGQNYDDYKAGETFISVTHTTTTIPATAQEGEYHLGVLATDLEGNESQVYIDIDIKEN